MATGSNSRSNKEVKKPKKDKSKGNAVAGAGKPAVLIAAKKMN